MKILKTLLTGLAIMLAGLVPGFAHVADVAHQHSFAQGLAHPLTGLDHLLAMVTLGLWAGSVGGPARWVWPATFVTVAAFGALLAQLGYSLPAQESLIAVSVIVLGGFVFAGLRIKILAGMVLSGSVAFVHGYAHGLEMPVESTVSGFVAGFLLATALLHGAGLAPRLNLLTRQVAGGLIAACGSLLLAWAL